MKRLSAAAAAFILLGFASVFGQLEPKFDFYTRGEYRPEVPRPQSILRYDVGDHHTTYAQMEQVIFAIAKAAPDRVKVFEIGTTNEHRMQYLVAISSPENLARLDQIKANVARLTDPRKTSRAEAEQIAQSNPAIAWMAYTIHGNESSSFEAFMQVVYQLAASNEPATLEILRNTVTLVLTGENPDGHERFATWYNSVAVGSPDRNAIEHREPWAIWGRVNHYRFNLNRDTLAMTQKESRNMAKAYNEWNPQVAVDHHGQPSQYFFPPVALPINPNLPQPMYNRWLEIYGRANAAAFDRNNWDYYVRDIFDAFYPGYWDMYPSLNGAIGMTYETDGGGFKGLNWTRDDGTIVTFRSSIAKHYVASMTTLEATARHKTERLKDFYEFRAKGMADHSSAKMKRVVIDPTSDRVKAAELIEVLRLSNIEVKAATAPFTSRTAHTYMEKDSRAETRTFPAGSYVIDLDQPQRIFIKAILEQDTPQDKAFVEENMARFRRNQMRGKGQPKEEYGFYDITAWSLPLSFGVDAWWTEETSSFTGTTVDAAYLERMKRGSVTGRASIAYVIPYESDASGALSMRLLQNGYRVAVATRQLNAGGRNWPAGTFVIRVSRNPAGVHDTIARFAEEMGANVVAVNSGYSEEGDTSVGGEAVVSMRAPRIAIAADEGVTQESYGAIWWTFDKFGIKFTPMTIAAIRSGALRNYNVLIIPEGSPGRYMASFGAPGVSTLKEFASSGGSIVTISGGSVFAALKDVGLSSTKLVGSDDDEEKGKVPAEPKPSPSPTPATRTTEPSVDPNSERESWIALGLPPIASPSADANKVPEPLAGAFFRAAVDRTTYMTYGIAKNEMPVLIASGYFFRLSKEGTNALVFEPNPRRPLTISGFVWEGNTERLLKGTAYVIDEKVGAGHVILFAEDPFFRGMTRANTRPFFNSILFNGIF
ncbi:MAG TPA: M14 family zinc carboxypeptidase [Pyrinomonadaceae bacterium]|nr:M14 family zinc carboxypeptidase [Pyrinomonadaceae bacterium]